MNPCQNKIQKASKLLYDQLYKVILDTSVDLIDCTLKLNFTSGSILYITYNNHGEYSYQLMYTKNKFDRERFDNYDKNWDVKTKPHHFHIRGKNEVIPSSMTGVLEEDMPKLLEFIRKKLGI